MQQFFKNAAEAWASSPHLRSKSNCRMKLQQKSKRKSEESQLPSKSEGCNEIQGFRGNCDSQGKLGIFPSLAEPDSGGFPRTSRRQIKSFSMQQFFKIVESKTFRLSVTPILYPKKTNNYNCNLHFVETYDILVTSSIQCDSR